LRVIDKYNPYHNNKLIEVNKVAQEYADYMGVDISEVVMSANPKTLSEMLDSKLIEGYLKEIDNLVEDNMVMFCNIKQIVKLRKYLGFKTIRRKFSCKRINYKI
jgi:hypothetical protein